METHQSFKLLIPTILLSLGSSSAALAQAVSVQDFCFFLDTGSSLAAIDNRTAPMQVLDYSDLPHNPIHSYKVGFGSSIDNTGIHGCAENVYVEPGFGEILEGQIAATLPAGTPPTAAWVVLDGQEDGIGTFDPATQTWTPGPDDYVFPPEVVSADGTLLSAGGAANFPVGGSSGSVLPALVVPEPGFGTLVALGVLGLAGAQTRRTRPDRPGR